jgi:hypothetical protein
MYELGMRHITVSFHSFSDARHVSNRRKTTASRCIVAFRTGPPASDLRNLVSIGTKRGVYVISAKCESRYSNAVAIGGSRATQPKEIVMFEKLSVGQTLVSGIGALLISTVFVLSAVSATDVCIDYSEPRAAILSYA